MSQGLKWNYILRDEIETEQKSAIKLLTFYSSILKKKLLNLLYVVGANNREISMKDKTEK